jgi:signal transduction histidine kinase
MDAIRHLLVVYAGLLVINVLLSGLLWAKERTLLHRDLLLVWAAFIVGFISQGIATEGDLTITIGFSTLFLLNYALSRLLADLVKIRLRAIPFVLGILVSLGLSVVASSLHAPFWVVALPVGMAVCSPLLHTLVRVIRAEGRNLSITARALLATCAVAALHDLDFAFLRDKEQLAPLGFTIALLIVFALAVSANAVVIEAETRQRVRVEDTNKFQRQFFANITHELRTPLTMILAPLDSLLAGDHGSLTATQRSYLESNQRNAIRLLKLINDLLDLAKMEEGFLRLRVERTDLRALLADVVHHARPLAARKKLTIDLQLRSDGLVEADAEKMERVVINLVSNALKFTSEGGVTIYLEEEGGELKFTVADTGIGISPEAMPRVFERFSQGDGSVTRRYGGTGVGLAYAKQIVELHDGRITVESTPGQGSRFTVHLKKGADVIPERVRDRRGGGASAGRSQRLDDQEPVEWALRLQRQLDYRFAEIDQVTNRRLVSRAAGQPTTSGRVLVVEDNPEVLELINLALRDKYTIYAAQDGKQGLEAAKRERPDVIITDYMMPEMDGLSMIKALREEPGLNDVPVIMLSARSQVEDRISVLEAGADIYLEKPFSPRELDASIHRLLEKQGRQVQNLMRAHVDGLEIVSAGLAHEIHNPLNFIKNANLLIAENVGKLQEQLGGIAQLAPDRAGAIDKIQTRIDRMVQSSTRGVERIEKVVELIRRYAREGYPSEPSDVDFDQAVAEVTELVAPRADMEDRVTLQLEAPGRMVRAIPEELNQIIRSLVQNACESVGQQNENGRVQVRTLVEGDNVAVEVSDNGPGISPENVAKIFAPFFTTKAGSGRGMGLSIVRIIIDRIGGTVNVTSTPGVKTTFRISLPIVKVVSTEATRAVG